MTIEYGKSDGIPGEKFRNSQFLVFVNRSVSLCNGSILI